MIKILVWILVLNSSAGGMVVVDNLDNWEDCERLRLRSQVSNRSDGHVYVAGACTQVAKWVPKEGTVTVNVPAPVVNVAPPQVTVKPRITVKAP